MYCLSEDSDEEKKSTSGMAPSWEVRPDLGGYRKIYQAICPIVQY